MECSRVLEELDRYHDREMSPGERAGMEEHLRSCANCSAVLKTLDDLDSLLKAHPGIEASPWFEKRFLSTLEEGRESRSRWVRVVGLLTRPAFALAAVLLLVLALKVGVIYRDSTREPEPVATADTDMIAEIDLLGSPDMELLLDEEFSDMLAGEMQDEG
jgi:anti-sigma factor RsiW